MGVQYVFRQAYRNRLKDAGAVQYHSSDATPPRFYSGINVSKDMHSLKKGTLMYYNSLEIGEAAQEKHQRMLQDAAAWRQAQRPVAATRPTKGLGRQLRPVLVALINLVAK